MGPRLATATDRTLSLHSAPAAAGQPAAPPQTPAEQDSHRSGDGVDDAPATLDTVDRAAMGAYNSASTGLGVANAAGPMVLAARGADVAAIDRIAMTTQAGRTATSMAEGTAYFGMAMAGGEVYRNAVNGASWERQGVPFADFTANAIGLAGPVGSVFAGSYGATRVVDDALGVTDALVGVNGETGEIERNHQRLRQHQVERLGQEWSDDLARESAQPVQTAPREMPRLDAPGVRVDKETLQVYKDGQLLGRLDKGGRWIPREPSE